MPVWVAPSSFMIPMVPDAATPAMSSSSTDLKGSLVCHSGCAEARRLTSAITNANCVYIGCSTQSVPSLSKSAMRSCSGTNSGLPSAVVRRTKSTIDCFASPSFHEGNASCCPFGGVVIVGAFSLGVRESAERSLPAYDEIPDPA